MQMKFAGAGLVLALSGSAAIAAEPLFLVFDGSNLLRTTAAGPIETFALSDDIVGGTIAPNGEIWLTSSTAGGNGLYELYRLDGAEGPAPSLSLVTDQLASIYTAITFIDDLIYASWEGSQTLVTVDPNNGFLETTLGATGMPRIGGFAYDGSTDTLYAVSGFDGVDGLITIDYAGSPPTGTFVGTFGFNVFHNGLELYRDVLYTAVGNADAGTFELGHVNRNTGGFTSFKLLGPAVEGPAALIVIPAPSSAALLAIGGLGMARRRR